MNRRFALIALVSVFLSAAAFAADPPPSIGTATIDADGTIKLHLMARGQGAVGDAVLVYKPSDPHYEEIKQHIGPIKPGETKPVPPWPEEKK